MPQIQYLSLTYVNGTYSRLQVFPFRTMQFNNVYYMYCGLICVGQFWLYIQTFPTKWYHRTFTSNPDKIIYKLNIFISGRNVTSFVKQLMISKALNIMLRPQFTRVFHQKYMIWYLLRTVMTRYGITFNHNHITMHLLFQVMSFCILFHRQTEINHVQCDKIYLITYHLIYPPT